MQVKLRKDVDMKKTAIVIALLLVLMQFSGCSNTKSSVEDEEVIDATDEAEKAAVSASDIRVEFSQEDLDSTWDKSQSVDIELSEDVNISETSQGIEISDDSLTITKGGTYVFQGEISNSQIVVNSQDDQNVHIILNGVTIKSESSAIYVQKAEKVIMTLAQGTENFISDGDSYIISGEAEDEPYGAIYSKEDLTINGEGFLEVKGNYKNGIVSKDELKIAGGTLEISAKNDGIRGRDMVSVYDGDVTVTCQGDGIQSNNDEDLQKGFVYIIDGDLKISAKADGIKAQSAILIEGGNFEIETESDSEDESAKGIKAGDDILVREGSFIINASDDAIHSNGNVGIEGGEFDIDSQDDGIHADESIVVDGGKINIRQSYEGIESASITINGGEIKVVSKDDGINVAGGADNSSVGGRPGQNSFNEDASRTLALNGGYIYISALGDGIDVNGSITMSEGSVIVDGPEDSRNGALDYDGDFVINGGTLIAVGSSGMAQAPGENSSQYSITASFSQQSGGTLVNIESEDGEIIVAFKAEKSFSSLVYSSAELQKGKTYKVYTGGSEQDTNAPSEELASIEITDIVTVYGSSATGAGEGDKSQRRKSENFNGEFYPSQR